ncbi:enoyl-CoA hydratase-related protein [Zhongshania aquimaris]|uniref:Enoyl-CoA hydratase/isomerase family protein n=1 Tax=Zhongshania aquimaris TaxID=2857107 RepID=A0ABS6VSR2_9GAMM|nr:enoyl-CoA hydratase-related protein [Zhongshania aquimaris]MBW2941356.1 enoyl-CoA hydratase/isomerase family protein [Zhongshania aquimaris]
MKKTLNLSDAELTLEDGIATLYFNRDDVRNALTGTALVDDIIATVDWVNEHHEVGALIITGNGNAFSSGGNVKDMYDRVGMFGGNPIEIQDRYRRGIQKMARALYQLEVPAIAAVNGAAIGAGLDVACMCDIRIGSDHAKVGETFVNLGIIPGDGGAWFLPRVVGKQRAAEMTFSGRIVGADEAKNIGLFLEVVPAAELIPYAKNMAAEFAKKPREALRISKRLLQVSERLELPDFLDFCAAQQSLCHTHEQHHQALGRFLNK